MQSLYQATRYIYALGRAFSFAFLLTSGLGGCTSTLEQMPWRNFDVFKVSKDPIQVNTCRPVAPEYSLHPVVACESTASYVLIIGEQKRVFDKVELQATLRNRIFAFVKEHGFPLRELKHAQLEVWVFAPVFNPLQAEFRVQLVTPRGNLLFNFPTNAEAWMIEKKYVTVLGHTSYPEIEYIWYPRVVGRELHFFTFPFFQF